MGSESINTSEGAQPAWYSSLVGNLPSKEEYEADKGLVISYTPLDKRGPKDTAPRDYIFQIRKNSDFYIGTDELLQFCKVDNQSL